MYEIEKGVPIPTPGRVTRYPFKDMEVGDSVFIPNKTIGFLTGSLYYLRPRKFTSRVDTVEGIRGTRIWRIA